MKAIIESVVEELDAMTGADREIEHSRADDLVLSFAPTEVREAVQRAQERADGWWYA